MNSTQNRKIAQVKNTTLVIGIDVGSEFHYARAFDDRGYEYSGKPLRFSNTESGFCELLAWMQEIKEKQGKENIIAGMEPTGHYWFCLGIFLRDNGIKPVLVNPQHVKKSKKKWCDGYFTCRTRHIPKKQIHIGREKGQYLRKTGIR